MTLRRARPSIASRRARVRGRGALRYAALAALVGLAAGCAAASTRDVVPESHDVREIDKGGSAAEGYAYVAKRPLGVVALAEARGLDDADARRAIDHLADALDACATELGRQGKLVDGAVRVVAQITPDGGVSGLNVKVGQAATASAILCVIAPLKLTSFPATGADAGARGIAIEATWGSPTR
jgi:hypothetical protein